MKNPGSLLFSLLSAAALHGSVTASLDKSSVEKGEMVTLLFRVEGEKIRMPLIDTVCGVKAELREHRTAVDGGEGRFQKAELYSFGFRPTSDCRIGPVPIEVDGAESYSQPLELKVGKYRSKADGDIVVELRTAKKELLVGEPFEVELIVKKRESAAGAVSAAAVPEMEHIWIKKAFGVTYTKEDGYTVARTRYLLAAQQAGDLRIYPAEIKIAVDRQRADAWGDVRQERSWESRFSNALELKVKAPPEELKLVGEFVIALAVDKKEIEAKEPLAAELTVRGIGNFEDIPALQPAVSGVELFAREPVLEKSGEGTEEGWHQKLTFVGERDFTIPPIVLDYFDLREGRAKRVQTQPVPIRVTGSDKAAPPAGSESGQPSGGAGAGWGVVLYLMGALSAALLLLVPWKRRLKARQGAQNVSSGDYRRALSMLLTHIEEPDVREMVEKLEARLYGGREEKIDQKELKKLLKRYRD